MPKSRSPRPGRAILDALLPAARPLDLHILGRTLFHAALVGAATGAVGALFFAGLEVVHKLLLEDLAGYEPLRAHGETFFRTATDHPFRPWVLFGLPAVGALLGGLLTWRFAPETQGGGADAAIEAFHHKGGAIRRRVLWVKPLASILTLGTGGSGGREGPTIQIGGAIGSFVGQALKVGARERQILLVAGVAGGIAAVFRTPLGAALLAVEVLYRDDFESDALVPAVLASVISYSVVISVFGETTLLAHAARYPFIPAHLPLYGLMALFVSLMAVAFVACLRAVQRRAVQLPIPAWVRPGLGGLALGVLAVPILLVVGDALGRPGQGLGILGGGYGAAQLAITGSDWLGTGSWRAVQILLLLGAAKIIASSLTIGTGGSAGDFAPSLAIGALFGGAFGRAMELLLADPRIDAGAFALVGMGAFYGGIAHAPLASLVLVCELAGSYDLLVPLMLAEGIAFVVLRRRSLYPSQVPTKRESPAHRDALILDALGGLRAGEVMLTGRPYVSFEPGTPAVEVMRKVSEVEWQQVFPVLGPEGRLVGIITAEGLRIVAASRELEAMTIAADVMQPPVTVRADDDLRAATEMMLRHAVVEVPVVGADGRILGFLGESEVAQAYLRATASAAATGGR